MRTWRHCAVRLVRDGHRIRPRTAGGLGLGDVRTDRFDTWVVAHFRQPLHPRSHLQAPRRAVRAARRSPEGARLLPPVRGAVEGRRPRAPAPRQRCAGAARPASARALEFPRRSFVSGIAAPPAGQPEYGLLTTRSRSPPPGRILPAMAELRERLQAALGEGYRVERELGGGGMSRVFVAQDTALGRRVVVKVLPPEMGAGVSVDRFEREIQLAANLQHPHIVPLLTAGSSDDLLYYIMPYIEGESLRAT